MVISLLSPHVSGLSFNIESPEEVRINEPFDVSILSETTDQYDVKIMVYDVSPRNIVSQLFYNDVWKSSFYYAKGAFPEQKKFSVRVKDFSGAATICGRMHKFNSTSSTFDESCEPIIVNANGSEAILNQTDNKEETKAVKDSKNKEENYTKPSFVPIDEKKEVIVNEPEPVAPKKIILGNKISEEQVAKTYVTKQGRTQQIIIYVFAGVCIVLAALIALGKA